MRKPAVVAISAAFSLPVLGQDLLQCVDPDVANGLISGSRSETRLTVTRTLPEALSAYRAPDGFELIGSAVRGDALLTTTAFKTELDTAEAFAALLGSFEEDGWVVEPDQAPQQTFNVTSQPLTGVVCRDRKRRALSVRETDGVRYASILLPAEMPSWECNAEDRRLGGMESFTALRAQMPKLDFPPTARPASGAPGIGGYSGSGQTVSTSSRISSPDTAASLAEHLAPQMTAQGWSVDASWSGSVSAGSTWTRRGADDTPYWGTLEVFSIGDDTYDVAFMIMTTPR